MTSVKVFTQIPWPVQTWDNFTSKLKATIVEVVSNDQIYVFFPKVERADNERFMWIEIFTEECYDKRLAIKQKVEAMARNFGVGARVPLQVVVQECLRA